ncbi:hypothetical protein Pmani_017578 [Petrolisthes manimaculis]|uniref:BTB domain-containing protein n=1 Tax=Petrolisthes manimaculis TaxID=1843537 RepID=A0AAE1PMR6_9EUCA|nr:hypothetical protein Pmani_017578 [Petrolisthes manimaculis]
MNRGKEVECTQTCRSRQHGARITAAIIRGTEAQAIAYMKSLCQRCCYVADETGKTALHTAASCGKKKIVKWLISKGVPLNQRDLESGYTPLHRALFYGHLHVACILIQAGCSVSTLDYDALTPLDHVNFDRHPVVSFTGSLPTHVYVWGSNTNYNLGQQAKQKPECVEALHREGHWITDLAMSKFHTVFVNSNGRVYTCGHGQGGRLGLHTNAPVITPQPIKTFSSINVVKAAVGPDHSLFLTDSGQVYSCGNNIHHQLGHNPPPENVYTPKLVMWHKSQKEVFAGIGAAKYHSVMWTSRMLYTCGLNAGQLGFFKNTNEPTVIIPRNVTSIVLKEDGNLACVGVSDGATVLSTSHGDVYVLHQYQIRKVTSKMLGIVKIACVGGYLDSKVGVGGLKEHGGDDLKIAVLTGEGAGHLYIWTQQSSCLSRCLFSISRKISVVDFCLSRHGFSMVTDEGEAFSGVLLPSRERKSSNKTTIKKAFGPFRQLFEFLDPASCVTLRLTRLPTLHRTTSIMCDPKGDNFAALQNDPSSFLLDLPEVSPSSWKADFRSFLEEASEMDSIHDVLIICELQKIPAHSYMLASRSGYFRSHLCVDKNNQPTSDKENPSPNAWSVLKENEKICFVFPDVNSDLMKQVLTYIYIGTCPFLTLPAVRNVKRNKGHNVSEKVNINTTLEESAFSHDDENMKRQTASKSRKKKGRKASEVKSTNSTNFQNMKSLAWNLQISSLVKELEKMKMYNLLEESDFDGIKEQKIHVKETPYQREKYKELWDVMINSKNGDLLGAHKCVLAAQLEYFRCMFSAGWLEATSSQTLNIPLPTSILTILLDYLYEDDSARLHQSHDPEFVCSVLAVADQFLVIRLKEICEKVLGGLLTLKNAADLLEFACRCNAEKLKVTAIQFICLNLPAVLENGSLLSIDNSELLGEISEYYRKFVHRMACRLLTPYDCRPYPEELERTLEENPVTLPESDEEWEDDTPSPREKSTPGSGGHSSTRRKKRPHRNSQGDGRSRKASTSSSLSTSSLEYDPCKDLENDLEALNFDDLKERDPIEPTVERFSELHTVATRVNESSVKQQKCQNNTADLPDFHGWKQVNRKKSTSGSMLQQESPDREITDCQKTDTGKQSEYLHNMGLQPSQANDSSTPESSSSVKTTIPHFPTLQDAIVSTQKTLHSTKSGKITKLSQKQRKKLAAEVQVTDSAKEEQAKILSNQSSPWGKSTQAWGIANTNVADVHSPTSGLTTTLADIMKAEETKVVKSPPVTIPKVKRSGISTVSSQVSPGKCWNAGKSSNVAWSMIATSPPGSPLPGSLPSPSSTQGVDSGSSPAQPPPPPPPPPPSFSHILLEEETLSDNLLRERSKPLSLIQIEDRAIEELLAFYGASECFEEKITVTRLRKTAIAVDLGSGRIRAASRGRVVSPRAGLLIGVGPRYKD